jgi:hypothetical protein
LTPSTAASARNPLRIVVVAERRGVGNLDAGAREIDREVERVATDEATVGSASELDQHFPNADDPGFLLCSNAK